MSMTRPILYLNGRMTSPGVGYARDWGTDNDALRRLRE